MVNDAEEPGPAPTSPRSAGHAVVEELRLHGVDTVFCVPGESYLDVLDGLHDAGDVRVVVCRHEAAAANMAVAHGKLTGRPGVCLVSRGPGATHAAIGVHIASQDSVPMLLLVGQVPGGHRRRDSFQEVDYERLFGSMARWVAEVDDPDRVPELLARAFHLAVAGRPGPVVLALPEDVLARPCRAAGAGPQRVTTPRPGSGDMEQVAELLAGAERPLLIAGGGGWTPAASDRLRLFAERARLPVAASFRSQDVVDNRSPAYVGGLGLGTSPALRSHLAGADLVVAIGTHLDEMTSGAYRLLESPTPHQALVHAYPDPRELGRVFQARLPVVATPATFVEAMAALDVRPAAHWPAVTARLREAYLRGREASSGGDVDLGAVVRHLSDRLPADAIITNGAGSYTAWLHRCYQFKQLGTQLAPVAGAMGFGVPAAVAARSLHPDRTVVCFAGDGCFLMSGQELATAMQHGLPFVVVVVDNGGYGSIRSQQQRRYPGRSVATDLRNPSFVAYARAFGAHAELVARTADFEPALERALAAGRPALLELPVAVSSGPPD